jgi:hypothetical protein
VVVGAAAVYLISARQEPSAEATLEGKLVVDGHPLGGVRFELRAEEHAAATGRGAISRVLYLTNTDADGRYRVTLRPGLVYTIAVRRPGDPKGEPLRQPDGKLPTVEAKPGVRHFDIRLVSS